MRIVELNPIREVPSDYDALEKYLIELFRKEIYLPLLRSVFKKPPKLLANARHTVDLKQALQNGSVTFHQGLFSGNFTAQISKELTRLGAKWSRVRNGFTIQKSKLPEGVIEAIEASRFQFQRTIDKLDRALSQLVPERIATSFNADKFFDKRLFETDRKVTKSMENVITVGPDLTPEKRAKIAESYTENMKRYIKGFSEEQIIKLRKTVQQKGFQGLRYENLETMIQTSYGASEHKAKFLARQETNLLMAAFKQTRYEARGIHEYKWRCVVGTKLHPTRPRHKELNDESLKGKIFRFDDPPISTGKGEPVRRNNPQEDYNCRCTAVPVIRMK